MDISIIIVSYSVRHYLRQCLDSVWASVRESGLEVEVFVVDNKSKDNSVEYIHESFPQEKYPSLHIIANHRNVGFGRANNQALRKASGKYVLYLNPDTIITEKTLRECYDFAELHDDLGAIGVKMLNVNGDFAFESRRGLPTPWVAFCKMSGLGQLFPKNRVLGRYYMRYLDENETSEIEIISGAFMFCSHKALEKCGSFDEKFFMYGEDIDLSYRFMEGGFHNWYLPTPILHYKGESTQKGSFDYVHTFYEAMLIFFQKHFPTTSFALALPVKFAILVQACLALVKQQMRDFLHYLHPSIDHTVLSVKYQEEEETPDELSEIFESWGLREEYDKADVNVYNAEKHTYADVLSRLEGSHSQLGMYYPSLHYLVLLRGIYGK